MKRTPLNRGKPLERGKPLLRGKPMPREPKRLAPTSKKRRADLPERAKVRAAVLARDRECRGRGLTPVACTVWSSDVHELKRGANRASCWLDPARCIGLCRTCHDWVTDQPKLARPLGLALRTGDPFPES